MQAARQACRPKHQVLVLKCYPKFQKNSADVHANSSELSYLLYYASTRRSKLVKVGDFLEKRTTQDVWKGRIGNVQVTLEILKALIEKCPRDLPLYAGAALRILRTILRSDDVTMVEESVRTFETLCAHQDPTILAAEEDYIRSYEEVVQLYALFASKEGLQTLKTPPSWPVAIRFRKAGLQALKAVASSELLASETGRQLAVIIPAVLGNTFPQNGEYLRTLEEREAEHEEMEQALRRRQSISTVRTVEDPEGDAVAAAGTTADADKLAEEEVGVIALQALKNIFVGVNRGQLRVATFEVIKFICTHVRAPKPGDVTDGWATTLMAMICTWAPVQDRYMILVSTTETLVRSPIVEDDLERQLVLASVIDYLLSSTINFIGLSVMDVLVGLIQHILLLLQLGGPGTHIQPHHQQVSSGIPEQENLDGIAPAVAGGVVMEIVKEPSPARVQLLRTLQKCMASLATHVYYSDQIADMVNAILSRLKPSPMSGVSNAAEAIQEPSEAVKAVASSASLKERAPHVDRFFSFETGRLLALQAVKDIIVTANTRRPDGSVASVSRNAVGVRVWENTQWLLRDPSGQVRKAYVDAVVTWLNLEMAKEDLRLLDSKPKKEKDGKGDLARRAVSNASHREKSPKPVRHTFLALLHLAVYESALHNLDSEPDFLLLHLLLTTLVSKLGINSVRTGLPMIWRLQEDIQTLANPAAKVMVGSLVHGYLWALSLALDFETSSVGRSLHSEISRRSEKGLWLTSIRVPPMPLDRIDTPHPSALRLPSDVVQHEALKPFDDRSGLVSRIAEGYSTSLASPPSSPPGSPSRSLSVSVAQSLSHTQTLKPVASLPYKVQEELLADWTREACMAANTKETSTGSMTGSRTNASQHRNTLYSSANYLGVAIPNGGMDSLNVSPLPSLSRRAHSRPPSTTYGLVGRMASPQRGGSPAGDAGFGGSTSSMHSAVRVDELKRVLSGSAPRTGYSIRPGSRGAWARYGEGNGEAEGEAPPSSGSESLVSVRSLSEASFMTGGDAHAHAVVPGQEKGKEKEKEPPSTPATTRTHPTGGATSPDSPKQLSPSNAAREREAAFAPTGVPPVPPIPDNLRDGTPAVVPNGGIAVRKTRSLKRGASGAENQDVTRSRSRGRTGRVTSSGHGNGNGTVKRAVSRKAPDFSGFLDSIDVEERGEGRELGTAPY